MEEMNAKNNNTQTDRMKKREKKREKIPSIETLTN